MNDQNDLPMPSDLSRPPPGAAAPGGDPLPEPPSAKLLVRLFLIPFIIVAIAVGIMLLIGRVASATPSFEEAIARLKNAGGERTADYLVGPGSKQRYLDAKTLVDKMKQGMDAGERIKLTDRLIDLIDHYTQAEEGEVRHFLLLALGRVWQVDPSKSDDTAMADVEARESRRKIVQALTRYAADQDVATRKAAVLAGVYLAGQDEARELLPMLLTKLRDKKEDLDVRLAAATVFGPLARPGDQDVVDALHDVMRQSDETQSELVWSAALSLAQLGQHDVADTILMLLDRQELSTMRYYDRESDAKNPAMRTLSDQEQQRILINTMIGIKNYDVPAVQEKLKQLAQSDPSARVRAAAQEVIKR